MSGVSGKNHHRARPWRTWGVITLTTALAATLIACAPTTGQSADTQEPVEQATGPATLVVWADAVRAEMFEKYAQENPDVTLEIVTLPDVNESVQQKIALANQAGSGWPDVVQIAKPLGVPMLNEPYNFAADLSDLIDDDVLSGFYPGPLEGCRQDDQIACLPNSTDPIVLLYNQRLMDEFGYDVPTTWEEYEELGLRVAVEHPGYIIGAAGGNITDRTYFSASRCPMHELIDPTTIFTDLSDERCVKTAQMLDNLIAAGSITPLGPGDPPVVSQFGLTNQVLMMPAPIFQARSLFQSQYETPAGELALAPPLRWADEEQAWVGATGGSGFIVSRHTEYREAAADLITWVSSGSVQYDPETVTVSAYAPAAQVWVDAVTENGTLTAAPGHDLLTIIEDAQAQIWPGYGETRLQGVTWGQAVSPALANNQTIVDTLPAWQQAIENEGRAAGFEVVNVRP